MRQVFEKIIGIVIRGLVCRVFDMTWIVSPVGEDCSPVPVYFVEDEKVFVVHRGIKVVENQ